MTSSLVVPAREILQRVPAHERANAIAATDLPPAKPEIDRLIETGEASSVVATRRLAGRLRTSIAELREALKAEAEQEKVLAEIAALRKQLDDAEAKLRRLRGVKAVPAGARAKVDTRKVRAWAVESGHQVKPSGLLPKAVLDAYRAAHGATS